MKTLLVRLIPGGLLVLAAFAVTTVPAFEASAAPFVPALPYAVFIGGVLLAWRFERMRVAFMLVLLALAERIVYAIAATAPPQGTGRIVYTAVAVLLPLNLAALSWLGERGRLGSRLAWLAGGFAAQVIAVVLVCQPEVATAAAAFSRPGLGRVTPLPLVALAAFGVAGTLAVARVLRDRNAIEAGALWALVAAGLALHAGWGLTPSVIFAVAGLVLFVSIIETSHAIAYGDELTGLPGRRALNEALARLEGRYVIAMVDIDHFKKFNDTYGHDVGDQLLRMVGARLAEVGGGGRAFRYGGEEFALIFTQCGLDDVLPHLEALRKTVDASGFVLRGRDRPLTKGPALRPSRNARRISVAVSIGVAAASRRLEDSDQVLEAADHALYRAKREGRNRVCTA
ncbi:MAG TPA: GGDEF domain-containing protein [Candidatus Limnocylindria bacterium]|nr:GGDEF domain-containing protein [Candidatus Limnocylindria bacterium]